MSISTFDLFKVGIGPSSSHTVGPMVAAKRFVESLNEEHLLAVHRVVAEMYGSLGATGKGHGTPKALMLGLMGLSPATINVDEVDGYIEAITQTQLISLLAKKNIQFSTDNDIILHRKQSLPAHANGMRFQAYDANNALLSERIYYSVGGGFVVDESHDGHRIVKDKQVLPYPFTTGAQLLSLCDSRGLDIAEVMFANELSWQNADTVNARLDELWTVMQSSVRRGLQQSGILPGGLRVARRAKKLHEKLLATGHSDDALVILDWVTLYALSVNEENASGGRIVTAPTNGAAGIIPAVLHYYSNFVPSASVDGVRRFLLTAAAIGILFKENASISGAEVGCQGEVGSACSMAAAGLTAVTGGTPAQIENAAEIAMEHHLGLTCDPIGGLVQVPCIERNAVASVQAIHATRMALANDGSHYVSLDKVIKTMRDTGKDMLDKYKETSRGGLALNVIDVPVNIVEC